MKPEVRDQRSEVSGQKSRFSFPLFTACCLLLTGLVAGCISPPATQQPLIIGQRVLAPAPGTVLTVPALTPPAKPWYLVDDVGIGQWLGIAPP